jgi:hypothetical protein
MRFERLNADEEEVLIGVFVGFAVLFVVLVIYAMWRKKKRK